MKEIMNTRDLLNAHLYPSAGDNIRRKSYEYYDSQAIATGTLEYYFFVTALGDQFLRNKILPVSGSEIFFVNEISAFLEIDINTLALIDDINELMQQAYLQVSIDNRVVMKIPVLDFLQYVYADTMTATGVVSVWGSNHTTRKLPMPIVINSTSSFEFRLVMNAAVATAFNGINFRLALHGVQLDKLESFYWDNLKSRQFQQVSVTYYQTTVIADDTETTSELFASPGESPLLNSQTFPLSDIQTFSLQDLEVFVNQPNTAVAPNLIYDSRITNVLRIHIDDVVYYESNLQNMLSMYAGVAGTLTTTPDVAAVTALNIRQHKALPVPIEFPANSKVRITFTQPASSIGITGEFTVLMRGVETRRVA